MRITKKQHKTIDRWASHYKKLMAKPQRGVITYGGGLNLMNWMAEAEKQGFHCTMTVAGVILR